MHPITIFHVLFAILASCVVLTTSIPPSDSLTTANPTHLDIIELMRTNSVQTMNHTIVYKTFTANSSDPIGPNARYGGTSSEFDDIGVQVWTENSCSGSSDFVYPAIIGDIRPLRPQIMSMMLSRDMTEYEVLTFYGLGGSRSPCAPVRAYVSGWKGFPVCWNIQPITSCYTIWKW